MEMQKMDGYTGAVARSMHNNFTREKKLMYLFGTVKWQLVSFMPA